MLGLSEESKTTVSSLGSIKKYRIIREIQPEKHLYPVFLAECYDFKRADTVKYVVKAISSQTSFENETSVYQLKSHPNILKCIECIEHYTLDFGKFKGKTYNLLVFPYLENGDIIDVIRKSYIDELTLRNYAEQILNAIEYLHKNGLAHRDIKPDNVLLDDQFNPILIDFGHTVRYTDDRGLKIFKSRSDITTPGICPPEFHKGVGYNGPAMDMFAFGRLLFSLATGLAPFTSSKKDDPLFSRIEKGHWEAYWKFVDGSAKKIWKTYPGLSAELKELLQGLLHPISDERFTIKDVRNSAWFENTEPKDIDEIQCEMMLLKFSD